MERIGRKRQKGEASVEVAVRKQIGCIRLDLAAMKTTERVLVVRRASLDMKIGQTQMNVAKLKETLERENEKLRRLQNLPVISVIFLEFVKSCFITFIYA